MVMRYSSCLFLILIVLILNNCTQEPDTNIHNPPYWGEASVIKNGVAWTGKPLASININHGKTIEMQIDSVDRHNFALEGCSLIKVPFEPGTYPLVNTDARINDGLVGASYNFMDYDVIMAYYLVAESDSSSFITVTSYDSLSGDIRGSFDATFAVYGRHDKSYPDTIRLRNGRFHTRIIPK